MSKHVAPLNSYTRSCVDCYYGIINFNLTLKSIYITRRVYNLEKYQQYTDN